MKTAKKIRLYDLLILGALTSVSLLSSCQKKLDTELSASDGMLRFEVSDTPQWQAGNVAASKAEPIDSASLKVQKIGDVWEDGQQMYLHTSVEPLGTIPQNVEVDTKGTVINQGKFFNTFGLLGMAYTGSSYNGFTPTFIYNAKATGGGGNAEVIDVTSSTVFQTTNKFYIPYGKNVALFAYAPYKDASNDSTWITVPAANKNWTAGRPQYDVEVPLYLKDHKDICFAEAVANSGSSGSTSLNFMHAMSAVRFDIDASVATCTVNSITLKNVRYKGTVTPNATNTSGGWWSATDDKREFSYNNGNAGISHRNGEQTNVFGNGKAYFMIPQDASAITLELSVQVGSGTARTLRKTLTGSWVKGNRYNYTLSFSPTDPTTFEVTTAASSGVSWSNQVGTISEQGGSFKFNVKSKKGTTERNYKVQYSTNGTNWYDLPASSATLMVGKSSKTGSNGTYTHTLEVFEKYKILSSQNTTLQGATELGIDSPKELDRTYPYQRNTANCYVVSAPGRYSFTTVYGNGYKDGAKNTDVIRSGESAYQDYKGNRIETPEFTANRARVLWTDVPGLISEISLSDRKVTFRIPRATIAEGNAVIGVFDRDGKCMWSWHIWVTPETSLTSQSLPNPSGATAQNGIASSKVLTIPLGYVHPGTINWPSDQVYVRFVQSDGTANGWITTNTRQFTLKKTAATGYSPGRYTLYQWGRKDPMWPISVTKSGTAQNAPTYPGPDGNRDYLPSLEVLEWPNPGSSVTLGAVVGDLFQYPHRPYGRVASAFLRKAFLWNASVDYSVEHANTYTAKKSIYDPCPHGYKIAPPGTFDSFSHNGSTYLGGIQKPVNPITPSGGYGTGRTTAVNYASIDNTNRIMYMKISSGSATFPIPLLGGRLYGESWQARRVGSHFFTWQTSRIDYDNVVAFGVSGSTYDLWIDLYGIGNYLSISKLQNAFPVLPVEE